MAYRLGAAAGRLCVAVSRNNTQVAGVKTSAGLSKKFADVPQYLQQKMKHFQLPNGLPVHVKGGPTDKFLYLTTAVLCTVGFIECFHVYYVLSYPKLQ